jgi:histidine ammonia-lyase
MLSNTSIEFYYLIDLQCNLVLSHTVGTNLDLSPEVVHLVLITKVVNLSRDYSSVRPTLVHVLIELFNADILLCIPTRVSVSISDDLTRLTHLSCVLIDEYCTILPDNRVVMNTEIMYTVSIEFFMLSPRKAWHCSTELRF